MTIQRLKLAAVILVLAGLLGCAPSGGPAGGTSTPGPVATQATEPAHTEATETASPGLSSPVVFFTWAEDDFEVSALKQMLQQFQAQHPEINVEMHLVAPEGVQR